MAGAAPGSTSSFARCCNLGAGSSWHAPTCLLWLTISRGTLLIAGEGSRPWDVGGELGQLAGAGEGDARCCLLQVTLLHSAVTWLWLSPMAMHGLEGTDELPSILLLAGRQLHGAEWYPVPCHAKALPQVLLAEAPAWCGQRKAAACSQD